MRTKSFNIVQLAILVLATSVVVTLVFVVLESNKDDRSRSWESTQLRGIHQGLIGYANSNNDWYPGINANGENVARAVEIRYQTLFEGDYLPAEFALSQYETNEGTEAWTEGQRVTRDHYSYAMLQVPDAGGRREEWANSVNIQAIVMSNRNVGTAENPRSLLSDEEEGWRGYVLWNDSHASFEIEDVMITQYGNGDLNATDQNIGTDHLFREDSTAPGNDDALLIHSGN